MFSQKKKKVVIETYLQAKAKSAQLLLTTRTVLRSTVSINAYWDTSSFIFNPPDLPVVLLGKTAGLGHGISQIKTLLSYLMKLIARL